MVSTVIKMSCVLLNASSWLHASASIDMNVSSMYLNISLSILYEISKVVKECRIEL